MSTTRNICFLAEKKSPMVKFIQQVIKKLNKDNKLTKFESIDAYRGGWWVFNDGEEVSYFGGEKVCKKLNVKLWASLGIGCNAVWHDNGRGYLYAVPHFRMLMKEIQKSGMSNDVYLLCYNDRGGEVNKTKPSWTKEWNGKFI
jgi:hypothetical protein